MSIGESINSPELRRKGKLHRFLFGESAAMAAILGFASLVVVGTAWIFELAGYLPCQLCLWQRIPYYIAGPLLVLSGGLGLSGAVADSKVRLALAAAGLIFVVSTFLAIYHAGVEWAFWPGPESCGVAGDAVETNAANLLDSLTSTVPPSCTEASARFLGLSFAGWNVIASIMIAAACFWAVKQPSEAN